MNFRSAALLLCLVSLGLATAAQAQATRTWVSGVGDDANPCDRITPCKTFAGALSKTLAGGEIDVLDPSGFGGVTITKSITVVGNGHSLAGVLVAGTNGIVVNAGASDVVVLKGLTIEGLGSGLSGVKFLAGKALHISDCTIKGFTQNGVDFSPPAGGSLMVQDSSLENNGQGILVQSSQELSSATLLRVKAQGNQVGMVTGPGGKLTVVRSVLSENATAGLLTTSDGGLAETNVEEGMFVHDGFGVQSVGNQAVVRLSKATIHDSEVHATQLTEGGRVLSFGNNRVVGQPPTQMVLSSPGDPGDGGMSAFEVVVTSDGGIPNGVVALKKNGELVRNAALDSTGKAALTAPAGLGPNQFTAEYPGTVNYAPSVSEPIQVGIPLRDSSCGCHAAPPELSLGLLGVLMAFRRRRSADPHHNARWRKGRSVRWQRQGKLPPTLWARMRLPWA